MKTSVKYYALLVLWLLFTTTGCKKAMFDSHVKGRVVGQSSGNGIAGATVTVLATSSNSLSIGGSHAVANTTTNNNGEFELTYREEREYTYSLRARKEKYWEDYGDHPVEKNMTLYLTPEAYLKLHIKNVNPVDAQDYFLLNEWYDINLNSIEKLYGTQIDTSITVIKKGNMINNITGFIHKAGNTVNRTENIYCPAFDTTYYDFNY